MVSQLDVAYTPLNRENLHVDQSFGPVQYSISRESHSKHISFVGKALNRTPSWVEGRLLPFQVWPLPRVLAASFGRLNETILISSTRNVHAEVSPEEILIGQARVRAITCKMGISFADFESSLTDASGNSCMDCSDRVLLLNSCDQDAVQRLIRTSTSHIDVSNLDILHSWTLQPRWEWHTDEWKNNIHTETYARSLGFETSLVEGPGIVDILLSLLQERKSVGKFALEWRHSGAAYESANVLAAIQSASNGQVRVVLGEPQGTLERARVILELSFSTS